MFPNTANQSQYWAIPATAAQFFNVQRPISGFVSAMNQPLNAASPTTITTNSLSTLAPSLSSATTTTTSCSSAATSSSSAPTTQMLRDFSLEIYDKKELQFLDTSAANSETPTTSN